MAIADAGCVLRVDIRCEQCKYKIMEVLSSIIGVYNVDVDGERGLVTIAGEVDPNYLLSSLARTGRHAEVVRVHFKHPNWNSGGNYSGGLHSLDAPGYHFPMSLGADGLSHGPVFGTDYPFRRGSYGCGVPRRRSFSAGYAPPYPRPYPRRGYGRLYGGNTGHVSCSCCNYM